MNRICQLFGIQYPVIQGGMVWCSGWRLASAVSNAGGLGLIGAGSMHPEVLREHIRKCQSTTDKPFGVNVPLMYPEIDALMNILVEEGVKIVFTSAGNPKTWTGFLKGHGIKVAHVVSSSKFAVKCEQAGVDAIVAEGFEAGGHNGREETTTLCLIPAVRRATTLPLIAAGGIGTGNAMLATFALGAEGVQILIFQEFKGTGNMEMVLDRKVAELRIWPAINLAASGTRREELLLSPKELEAASFLRRAMAGSKVEDAAETLIERMGQTKSNAEFLSLIL